MTEKKWRIISVLLMLILVPSLIANFAGRTRTSDEQQVDNNVPVADEKGDEQQVDNNVPVVDEKSDTIPFYFAETMDSEVDEAIVSRYYGSCDTADNLMTYEILMIYHRPTTPEEHGHPYEFILNFYKFNSSEIKQKISYTSECCSWPESITQGLVVLDVNKDGSDDFLLNLGLIGQREHTACFVYSSGKGYVEVEGFSDLSYPQYNGELFVTEEPGEQGREYYQVIGDKLVLVE